MEGVWGQVGTVGPPEQHIYGLTGIWWGSRLSPGVTSALDMSATYAAVYSVVLPKAAQVVDPFHLIALANRALDSFRRRVQVEQLGHRGRRDDPLYRAHRRARQPGQADQAHRVRLPQLRELQDQGAALRRQAELARPGIDRRPVSRQAPPDSDVPLVTSCSSGREGGI